jgi:pilus assembly protein Flp/PilA
MHQSAACAQLLGATPMQQWCRKAFLTCKEIHMTTFLRNATRFWEDESGAGAIEYGLIAALIAVVLITALGGVGTSLTNFFNYISGEIDAAR